MSNKAATKTYYAMRDFMQNGQVIRPAQPIELSERQAKHLRINRTITEDKKKAEAAAKALVKALVKARAEKAEQATKASDEEAKA